MSRGFSRSGSAGLAEPPSVSRAPSGSASDVRSEGDVSARSALSRPLSRRMHFSTRRVRDISVWSRQLLVLLRSGMPIADGLAAIIRQTPEGASREVLSDVHRMLEEGVSFADAMAHHPKHFDPVSRGLIAAGESSGQIDVMLERLAQLSRQQLRLRRTLAGALVYPVLLLFVAVTVVLVMLGFVLPRFEGLFETLEVSLPPSTEILMSLSAGLRANWWALAGVLALVGVAAKATVSLPAGRRLVDRWVLGLPVIGRIRRSLETARIIRLLGVLLDSRVPILHALDLTEQATMNLEYVALVREAQDSVTRGNTMSSTFRRSGLISPAVTEAIHHGEASGEPGTVLTNLADFMDEDNETLVKTLTTVLEPLIMILLGAIVAFIAISMFLPLFDLTAMTQGG